VSDYNTTPLPPARQVPAPQGWNYLPHFDPFEAHLGPFFVREADGAHEYALIVDDRHMNARGVAHGGALLTFADACLGYAIWNATDHSPCVTVSQQSNFLAAVDEGDFVVCRPEVVRKTREVIFVRADFYVGDRTVFTATAIWRIWPKAAVKEA
jgi:uncharacterized protein (TIGR00369 family)